MNLAIPRTTTVEIGGTAFKRDTFKIAVDGWTQDAITMFLRETATDITADQARMGNLPSAITVDNSSFKPISEAERRVVVLFGQKLAQAVINAIRQALTATIDMTTQARTGSLRDLDSWEWTYVPGAGKGTAKVVNPFDIPMMGFSDRLILRPRVEYASSVNSNVRKGSRAISFRVKTTDKQSAKTKVRKLRNNTQQGFFGAAANLMRRNSMISSNFSVYASFTSKHAIAGERWKAGKSMPLTAQIVLRPKRRGRLK